MIWSWQAWVGIKWWLWVAFVEAPLTALVLWLIAHCAYWSDDDVSLPQLPESDGESELP